MTTWTPTRFRKTPDSGVLSFDGRTISYVSQFYGAWSYPLDDVAVIGEFTTDNGPMIDDWFLVFVPRTGAEWFEASNYADGSDKMRLQLSVALGAPIQSSLAASTDFSSSVIWPPILSTRPLFNFSTVTATTLFRRIKLTMFPEIRHCLSPDVLSYLNQAV